MYGTEIVVPAQAPGVLKEEAVPRPVAEKAACTSSDPLTVEFDASGTALEQVLEGIMAVPES